MSSAPTSSVAPIALHHDEGEALWFLGFLATIKASSETTGGRVAVIQHLAPRGAPEPRSVRRVPHQSIRTDPPRIPHVQKLRAGPRQIHSTICIGSTRLHIGRQ